MTENWLFCETNKYVITNIDGEEQKLDISNDKIKSAFNLAKKVHSGKNRKSGLPYIIHPVEVAIIVQENHPTNEDAIIAALLHDTTEDCPHIINHDMIETAFGKKISNIVEELDDCKKIKNLKVCSTKELKRKCQIDCLDQMSYEGQIIRLADKLSNIRDIENINPSVEKQAEYLKFTKQVYKKLKDINSPLSKLLKNKITECEKKYRAV